MNRKVLVSLSTVASMAAVTAIMAVGAPSAGAAERFEKSRAKSGGKCPVGAVCLFTETNFHGKMVVDKKAEGTMSYGDANDTFSSIENLSREDICFFRDEDFQGPSITLHHDRVFRDLELWTNALRSHRPC